MTTRSSTWTAALLILAIAGCWRSSTPSPGGSTNPQAGVNAKTGPEEAQSEADRLLERQLEVDTLYLTEDGREIVAPGNRQGVIVEPGTGKLAWAAWECNNPACPGRKPDDRPLLFPRPDPFFFAKPDGTVGLRQPATEAELLQADENRDVRCPACLKTRSLAAETPQQRQQYRNWCRLYVLPQAAEQRKKLAEEYRRLLGGG